MRMTPHYSEEELLALLKEGSGEAFSLIYERYWKKLLGIAYNHTRDKASAEEIVQEVFISFWNRRFVLQVGAVENYLAIAVKFATFKKLRRQRRQQEIENRELTFEEAQFDEELIDARFLKEYIDAVVEKLPEKCQLVFRLSREDFRSNRFISEELGLSEKTVEAHITRALKILRVSLRRLGLSTILFFLF